ncbi:MAG TPA: LptF/LptG family permease [Gemmatimonadota bacterium]|nr:LptF/LptG family permease [Gemmatimonadota bacterium]
MSRWREWFSARTLSLYALREHLGPFAFALTVFTFIMLMNQVARQFQNLAGKGLGAELIVEVFVLSIPLSVAITIPMAVLVATMAAFGRLAGDNEVTAMQANGVGFHQILAPTVGAALALTLFTFWFNDRVLPESNHRLSQLMMEIQRAKPTVVLQEKRIVDPTGLGEYRILPDHIDRTTNMMYGVRIFDTTDLQIQRTIIADSGRMDYTENGEDAVLTLWHGTIHNRSVSKPGEYERLAFVQQRMVLQGVGSRIERASELAGMRSDREMNLETLMDNVHNEEDRIRAARRELERTAERHLATLLGDTLTVARIDSLTAAEQADTLSSAILPVRDVGFERALDEQRYRVSMIARLNEGIDYAARQRNKFLVEYHKKYAIPVACFVFVLIGAPVGVRARRGGLGFAMGMSTLVFVFYYLALTGGENLSDRRLLPPWLGMWISNLVFFAFGLWLLRRTARETASRRLWLPRWWPKRLGGRRDEEPRADGA